MTDITEQPKPGADDPLRLTRTVVSAYMRNNSIPLADVPGLIRSVYVSLTGISGGAPAEAITPKPAVPIKKSVTGDYIVCLEDGKKLKMLKRYIRSRFNLTPDQYRTKWGLPHDYPMTAPSYAAQRSVLAKKAGLGRTRPKARRRKRS